MNRMSSTNGNHDKWNPKIIAFFCNWCTYTAADLAGVSRMKYEPSTRIIRVMCSGRVDPQHVLKAFSKGADGVLIGGCHFGDCHYLEGNHKTIRRYYFLKRIISDMGINPDRLRLEWISAAEGEKVQKVVNDMTQHIRELGPLQIEVDISDKKEIQSDNTLQTVMEEESADV